MPNQITPADRRDLRLLLRWFVLPFCALVWGAWSVLP